MDLRLSQLIPRPDLLRHLRQVSPLFYLCAIVLVASLILGGGTRGGFLSDTILQLIALPLLGLSLWKITEAPLTRQARLILLFCCVLAAVPLLQLIPLPPWLWTALPNRAEWVGVFDTPGHGIPWMPLSIAPQETWISVLGLIAPLAIFLAILLLSYRERRWLSLVILCIGTFSVFIGLLQVAQGPESTWRFFAITNPTEAVGFFANRNHFAALGYVLVLFAAAWATQAAVFASRRFDTISIALALACFCLLVVLLAGEAMARSRAGLGLTMVALFGAFALGVSDRRVSTAFAPMRFGLSPSKLILAATLVALVLTVQYALYRILQRFEVDPLHDARLAFIPTTLEAARAYFPFGSGLGTFVPVYGAFEKPEDTRLNMYANHAHNDAAEAFLETGIVGLILVVTFVAWLVWRALQIWRSPPASGARDIDWSLARAATLVIALILAHSFVDYPLRTAAITAVFAFSCALLTQPLVAPEPVTDTDSERARPRRRSRLRPAPVHMPPVGPGPARPSDAATSSPGARWGADVEWPEEWQKPTPDKSRS